MKISRARATELAILVSKKECEDCFFCYEAWNELRCSACKQCISTMENNKELCPECDKDRLREEMTEEEYDAYRHNRLEIQEDVVCIEFNCDDDLSKYKNSMLFDSAPSENGNIAKGVFVCGKDSLEIFLDVCGEVSVTYKDKVYHKPSEFPKELIEKIKNQPNWECDEDVCVNMNNWFEYLFDGDGEVWEDNPADITPNEILADMIRIANRYFGIKED